MDSIDGNSWTHDAFHPNDIDPLPEALVDLYPGFAAGDLLISLRSLNLVFVLDPDSREVKWWRAGLGRRQHDPDWNSRGTITNYNNNMHRRHSSIIEVDPHSMERRLRVDGADYDFYNWHRGKHDELPGGQFLITSPEQGRAFEVDADGRVIFDFHNAFSETHGPLGIAEARFLPLDYFDALPTCDR